MLQVRRAPQAKCLQNEKGGCHVLKMQQARPHDEGMPEQEQQVSGQRITQEEFCQNNTRHGTITSTGALGVTSGVRQRGALAINYATPALLTRIGEYRRGIPHLSPAGHRLHQDYHQRTSHSATQPGADYK